MYAERMSRAALAIHLVGREELDPDPAPSPAVVLIVRPSPSNAVVGEEEIPVRPRFQRQGALSGPGNLHSSSAKARGVFMGFGYPMRQFGSVFVFEDKRAVTALDDQGKG